MLSASSYFYYPNYDIAAAEYSEKKKQAFSIAEFLTFSAAGYDASAYTGSALVRTHTHVSAQVTSLTFTIRRLLLQKQTT